MKIQKESTLSSMIKDIDDYTIAKLYKEKQLEIEKRIKAEEKLAENESLLNSILETLPVGLWLSNEDGEFIRGNDKAFDIWDCKNGNANPTLKRICSFWSGKEDKEENEKISAIKKQLNEKLKNDTINILLSDGTIKTISTSALPIYSKDGRITGAVVVNQDITEIREFESELIRSERRFHMLADNMSQCAWMADENGNRFWFNRRWYDYTGTTPDEMLGCGWYKVHHPDHIMQVISKIQNSIITGEPWEDTVQLRGRDGQYRWFLGRALPVHDEAGRITHWFGTNTDITEQKLHEEELNAALQKLEHSNKELEQFAYVASHDLQEPLRMVSNYMMLLEQKYKNQLDEKAREYINYAVDGSKRMANLIKDLLVYSRVTSHAKEFDKTDLNSIYCDAITDLQMLIKETDTHIYSSDLPTLCCDSTQIRQLFQNLIGNAIKFRGEKTPEISIEAAKEQNEWLFKVKDNGIGIDPVYYDKIFQVFQRLHEQGRYPGTGIGLALCKKIVNRHGGRIWLESEEGKGSVFNFTLPA